MNKIILLLLSTISLSIYAQSPVIIAMGNNNSSMVGQHGIVDADDNFVMIGKKFITGDNLHIAMFNKFNVYQWSFYINEIVTASKVIQTRDKNYVAIFSNGTFAIVMKFSPSGAITWYRKFTNIHSIEDVIEDKVTSDLYLAGNNISRMILAKLTSAGAVTWSYGYEESPMSNYFFGRAIIETSDGNLLIAGAASFVSSPSAGNTALFKIDKAGTILWSTIFKCPTRSIVLKSALVSSVDKSVCIVGYSGSMNNANSFNAFALHADSIGNYLNNQDLDFSWWDMYNGVAESSEGGFVAIGMSKPHEVCGGNVFYTKFNSNLDTVFNKVYGNSAGTGALFNNITRAKNNTGYYSFGYGSLWGMYSNGADYQYVLVDNILEAACKKYNQTFTATTLTITQTSNAILKAAFTPTFGESFVKVSDTMYATNSCTGQVLSTSNLNTNSITQIYPNPSTTHFTIQNDTQLIEEVNIFSIDGKMIFSANVKANEFVITTSSWNEGMYVAKIKLADNSYQIKKIIVKNN